MSLSGSTKITKTEKIKLNIKKLLNEKKRKKKDKNKVTKMTTENIKIQGN